MRTRTHLPFEYLVHLKKEKETKNKCSYEFIDQHKIPELLLFSSVCYFPCKTTKRLVCCLCILRVREKTPPYSNIKRG